jgi:hypothetical protein
MDPSTILQDLADPPWRSFGEDLRAPKRPCHFLARDLSEHALRPPPETTFTKAELAAAGQDAFAAGRAAGLAEASASQAAAEAVVIAAIGDALRDAAGEAGRVADQSAVALARTLLAAMQAVVPNLIERTALTETRAMLAQLLPGLSREPHVQVTVPCGLESGIEAMLDALPPSDRERITLVGSSSFGRGEAEVAWSAGHALRRPDRVWEAVMNALEPALNPRTEDNYDVQ